MKNQKNLMTILVVVGLLIIVAILFSQSRDTTDQQDTDVLTGTDQNTQTQTLTQTQRESIVSTYITARIGELSPELPVLGGTFYVTEISFSGESEGTVSYEDGHIALMADFDYSINEAIIAQWEAAVDVELSNVREQ